LRNQKNSPLLRLPGEIRNKIYEYAYGGMIIKVYGDPEGDSIHEQGSWTRLSFSLEDLFTSTMVCRQIHSEIGLIPLLNNELWFEMGTMSPRLSMMAPTQRNEIKTIWVYIHDIGSLTENVQLEIKHLDGLELVNIVKSSAEDFRSLPFEIFEFAVSLRIYWQDNVRYKPCSIALPSSVQM
jgi:hypothetical protein